MSGEPRNHEWKVPEDAVFESAAHLPHDLYVKPNSHNAIHLEGDSRKGEAVEYLHFDDVDGTFTHEIKADIEPVLKNVAQMHSLQGANVGKNKAGDFYLAARVDRVVVQAWLNKLGLTWKDFKGEIVERFLNDSDNKAFRVWSGKV